MNEVEEKIRETEKELRWKQKLKMTQRIKTLTESCIRKQRRRRSIGNEIGRGERQFVGRLQKLTVDASYKSPRKWNGNGVTFK